jgi:Zn-dependent protease
MRFTFTQPERRDLAKSWLLVSLAFAVFITWTNGWPSGGMFSLGFLQAFLLALAAAALTVGVGFLLHELAHKYVAQRYDCHAEYRADNMMLIASLALSPFIFIAAPGAVHISGHANQEQGGRISLSGPAMNLLLGLVFLLLYFLVSHPTLRMVAGLGAIVNSTLGLFNLIPFPPFDGAKVFWWSKGWYALALIVAMLLIFASFMVVQKQLGLF